jgi:hypothetical protein
LGSGNRLFALLIPKFSWITYTAINDYGKFLNKFEEPLWYETASGNNFVAYLYIDIRVCPSRDCNGRYTAINDYGKFLNKFEEFGASDFFKESARIFRNQESLNWSENSRNDSGIFRKAFGFHLPANIILPLFLLTSEPVCTA